MKIAICGKNKLCLVDAPWGDNSWEIWGLNVGEYDWFPRFDKWFDLHNLKNGLPCYLSDLNTIYGQFLLNNQSKIILQEKSPLLPEATAFPIKEILQYFQTKYFKCSIALMIAYAIYLGAEEIGLWGCDPPDEEKYRDQEENICFWFGVAEGRGIKVHTSFNSSLLKSDFIYGYEKTAEEILNV